MEREPGEAPTSYTPEPESRQDEQRYVQGFVEHNEAAERLIAEYELIMSSLEGHFNDVVGRMEAMRASGLPDPAAYKKLGRESVDSFKKVKALHEELGKVADGITGASPAVVARARETMDALQGEQERVEDTYRRLIDDHVAWTKQHPADAARGRVRRTTDIEGGERTTPPEMYEEKVRALQEMIGAIESETDLLVKNGRFQPADADELNRQIDDVHERLQELDATTPNPTGSRERPFIMKLMGELRQRISEERAKVTPPAVAAARAKYGFVKDQYASVAHQLSEPQRREMRSYLARLTSLVNELETTHVLRSAMTRADETATKIVAAVMPDDEPHA